MSTLSLPTEPQGFFTYGDIDVFNGTSSNTGDGTVYIRGGGLYVEGLTDLDQTTINTTDGELNISGSNKVSINISGGATSSVEITAEDASFLTTTAGTLTMSATDTASNGKVIIAASGTGTDSILINALNTTSGQVTIQSAGASTTTDAIRLLATNSTDGNILISGSGNNAAGNPSVKIIADNATSGKVLITSIGDSATDDSIVLLATGATNGNVLIQSDGTTNAVELFANNTSGRVYVHTTGTGVDSIKLQTDGGISLDAIGRVNVESADTTNGVKIGTVTAGVPITIGTNTSLVTINGNLNVTGVSTGSFTTINSQSLEILDNFAIVNSGSGEAGLDTGILMKRYQIPNDTGAGDVVSHPSPVQESGALLGGTTTTVSLSANSSNVLDFYKGWWIKITSGTQVNAVRRIKSYNQTTKVATIYATADNTVGPPVFSDGLDFVGAPSATDTYELYSRSYTTNFYGETLDRIISGSVANAPNSIDSAGISTAVVQQYQNTSSGAHYVHDQIYNNARVVGTGTTTLTITLKNHGEIAGNSVRITNSYNLTPAVADGIYIIQTVPNANTFTVTALTSITSDDTASSATVTSLHSSVLYANILKPFDSDFGLVIDGLTLVQNISLGRTSTAFSFVSSLALYGSYVITVSGITPTYTNGAYAVFVLTCNGTNNGSVSRLVNTRGDFGERLDMAWVATEKPKIRHSPAASAGSPDPLIYRLRVFTN